MPATSSTTALPVLLALAGRIAEPVRRHVEGVLGWQSVDATEGGLVPAAIRLTDVAGALAAARAGAGSDQATVPTLLLVTATDPPAEAARSAAALPPGAVLAWPEDRDELADRAGQLLHAARQRPVRTRMLHVGGASGGVGTSTVVLALAGLLGWSGQRALAVVGPGAPVGAVRSLPPEAVAAVDLWGRASELPGVAGVRAVRLAGPGRCPVLDDPAIADAVVDDGVAHDVDVLVLRPDAAGLSAAAGTTAGCLVVVGGGPARPRDVAAACGRRLRIDLPRSVRVARAGLHQRVPGSLPGTFVARLIPLLPAGLRAELPAGLPAPRSAAPNRRPWGASPRASG